MPSETGMTYEEMIEQKNIQHYYRRSTNPPCQSGITLKIEDERLLPPEPPRREEVFLLAISTFLVKKPFVLLTYNNMIISYYLACSN